MEAYVRSKYTFNLIIRVGLFSFHRVISGICSVLFSYRAVSMGIIQAEEILQLITMISQSTQKINCALRYLKTFFSYNCIHFFPFFKTKKSKIHDTALKNRNWSKEDVPFSYARPQKGEQCIMSSQIT